MDPLRWARQYTAPGGHKLSSHSDTTPCHDTLQPLLQLGQRGVVGAKPLALGCYRRIHSLSFMRR